VPGHPTFLMYSPAILHAEFASFQKSYKHTIPSAYNTSSQQFQRETESAKPHHAGMNSRIGCSRCIPLETTRCLLKVDNRRELNYYDKIKIRLPNLGSRRIDVWNCCVLKKVGSNPFFNVTHLSPLYHHLTLVTFHILDLFRSNCKENLPSSQVVVSCCNTTLTANTTVHNHIFSVDQSVIRLLPSSVYYGGFLFRHDAPNGE
jgi:hypothetical protein